MLRNLKNSVHIANPYKEEFNRMNARFNNRTATFLSSIYIVIIIVTITVGLIAYYNGNKDVSEIIVILPIYALMLVISIAAIIILVILKRKGKDDSKASEIVSVIQVSLCLALMLISSHIEIPQTKIKNINAIILIMFAIVFFLRFKILVVLSIQLAATIASIIFLMFEKNDISNFLPSLVNICCAGILSSICAFLYWKSRIENYVMSNDFKKLATSDALTKVFNRRGFDAYFSRAWDECTTDNSLVAMFIVDIDYFKKYNDYYGHIKGDECLSLVADSLAKSIRKNDFIARYGGEEFAIIMVDTDFRSAKLVAERIFNNIKDCNIAHRDSPVSQIVTISIGCMVCHPQTDGITQLEFLALADEALYMAKERGRNRLVFHPNIKNI